MTTPTLSQSARQLEFTDNDGCRRWLESLPLTNIAVAQRAIAAQAALLKNAQLPSAERLKILELLGEPSGFVQNESAKKFDGKPLPLEPQELAAWQGTVALWQSMANNYEVCRAALAQGDADLAPHGALITLRCLQHTGRTMFEYYRVYQDIDASLWRALHALYLFAENAGFARTPVPDAFGAGAARSSCGAVYAGALLARLANPYALSVRQTGLLKRWLETWSGLVNFVAQPPAASSVPALAVDLAGDAGAVPGEHLAPSPHLRYLDLEPLSQTLRQLLGMLKQGQAPAKLGLGENVPGCENTIMLLYIQWCRAGANRMEERTLADQRAQVGLGWHAVHFYVSGRAFRQPGQSLSRQEENDLSMFGHVSQRTEWFLASQQNWAVESESWEIVNQSASGVMCMIRQPDAAARIGHNQLVAVRGTASVQFYLGTVQWLRVNTDQRLQVGVRLFPGIPGALAARPYEKNPKLAARYERALLLPEIAAPATPSTLILPSGWYQPGRVVELYAEEKQTATLANLVERGADFDRCTFKLN